MSRLIRRLELVPFVAATLLGAFLVFQVQPVISKTVLPWFGGSPAVWTTCMLFFQLLLFGGYLYAHLLTSRVPRRWQGIVHAALLIVAVLALPIRPDDAWKPVGDWPPVAYLLTLLAVHVGVPYFVLASTGPLVQAWLARRRSDGGVYRLYAFSNLGSLAALDSYPLVVEPWLAIGGQTTVWSLLFCLFALVQGLLALWLGSVLPRSAASVDGASGGRAGDGEPTTGLAAATPDTDGGRAGVRPSRYRRCAWLLLPALASVTLLAVTNHVCQDVAVIPFLWVLPLGLYLLSFIICFDRAGWYRPRCYAQATLLLVAAAAVIAWTPLRGWLIADATVHLGLLMMVCMLCHGEVARLKPHPRYLTEYYLLLSAGGALGGLVVALLCPTLFAGYRELPLCLGAATGLAAAVCLGYRSGTPLAGRFDLRRVRRLRGGFAALSLLAAWMLSDAGPAGVQASSRNFFGVLRVVRFDDCTGMMHGRTLHGLQIDAPAALQPTTYYGQHSGVGRLLAALSERGPVRLAGIGLGCGTLAAYSRPGDRYEFVEINPEVTRLARQYFTYLSQARGDVSVTLGDGRLVLERHPETHFDVIVLDAFSSDSVPAHLVTREALAMYRRCLRPDGAIVVHVTNRHLRLAPVVHRLADDAGLRSALFRSDKDLEQKTLPADWVVIAARDCPLWQSPQLAEGEPPAPAELAAAPLWTDDYHDLFRIMRLRSRQ